MMASTGDGSEPSRKSFEPISGAVSEHIAARRLGVSVWLLREDRHHGRLGIPFIKIGEGKRGLVRYDLADLERWVEEKKRVGRAPVQVKPPVTEPTVTEPPAREQPPAPVTQPETRAVEPWEPEPRIDKPPAPRRSPPQTPWEALAETVLAELEDEPLDDPFATGRTQRRSPGGYFRGGF